MADLADLAESLLGSLQQIDVEIANLPDSQLGLSLTDKALGDWDGTGCGWPLDSTLQTDEPSDRAACARSLLASESIAWKRIDLLTALMLELDSLDRLGDL